MSCSSIESERKTELVGFTNVINPRIKKIIDFQSRPLTPSPIHTYYGSCYTFRIKDSRYLDTIK